MSEKILLVTYQFCPKGRIGTRRWSKFAKYLAKRNYEVHVLCARYRYADEINWCHDVENNPKIKIHRIAAMYPTFLLSPYRTLGVKLFDRLSRILFSQDYAQWWYLALLPATKRLIQKEKIRTIIVTGGPFSPMYHAAKLKKKFGENLYLILDFRDPWSTWLSSRSYLQRRKKKIAERKETYALRVSNKVLFTTQALKDLYANRFPSLASSFAVLYNGYDEDDFMKIKELLPGRSMDVVYAGSLTKERVDGIVAIIKALSTSTDPYLHKHLNISLYGFDYQYPSIANSELRKLYEKHVKHKGVLPQQKIFETLSQYSICLSINAKGHEDLIGAKTFEYMGLKKRILLISQPGEFYHILKSKNQFVADFSSASIRQVLLQLKEDILHHPKTIRNDYSEFEYNRLTNQLISYLACPPIRSPKIDDGSS